MELLSHRRVWYAIDIVVTRTSSNALYAKLLFSLLLAKVNRCSSSEGRQKLSLSSFAIVLCCPVKGACSLFRNHDRHFFLSVVCCEPSTKDTSLTRCFVEGSLEELEKQHGVSCRFVGVRAGWGG